MTVEESLAAVTRNAAKALGLGEDRGTLEIGKRADFVLWDIASPADLVYAVGAEPVTEIIREGSSVR